MYLHQIFTDLGKWQKCLIIIEQNLRKTATVFTEKKIQRKLTNEFRHAYFSGIYLH
jgi:hypothetical protein